MATAISRVGIKIVMQRPETIPPISNLPAGKVRISFQPGQFAKAIVRTATGIRAMVIEDCGSEWKARPDLWCREKVTAVRRVANLPGANIRKFRLFAFT